MPPSAAAYPWRPERVRVGTVGKGHGLDGSFYVDGPCGWWTFPVRSEVAVDGVVRRVRRRAGTDDRPILALDDATSREDADALRGRALEIGREALPAPELDSYFHFDLIGCEVVCGERPLGRVSAVEEGVANDVLVLDDEAETRLPFVFAWVPEVRIRERRIGVTEGLL